MTFCTAHAPPPPPPPAREPERRLVRPAPAPKWRFTDWASL
jgi:hypothetical protein